MSLDALAAPIQAGDIRVVPWEDSHSAALRAVCDRDHDIWDIYPVSMQGEHFDRVMETRMAFHRAGRWVPLICLLGTRVVGTTNYIDCDETQGVLEIGGTLLDPDVRGTGYNGTLKRLMIERAFACGYTRVEFRVDTRNARSMAAVAKLGAVHEGTLRRNKTTWTGYRRDTAIYGLLKDEWRSTAG